MTTPRKRGSTRTATVHVHVHSAAAHHTAKKHHVKHVTRKKK